MDSLQLTLVAGLLILAMLNGIGFLWLALRLDRQFRAHQLTIAKAYDVHVDSAQVLTEIDMREIEKQARSQLLKTGDEAAKRLRQSLESTVDQVAADINDLTSMQLSQEFEKYQVSLQALRDQSITEFTKLQKELEQEKARLIEHMDRTVAKERAQRMDQFNSRLNDVVSSYLSECLGNQVDLGAQSTYIFAVLQQHKDDIKRDVLS